VADDTITLSFYVDDLDIDDDIAHYRMTLDELRRWLPALHAALDGLGMSEVPVVGGDG
jgi:hypothetical protein